MRTMRILATANANKSAIALLVSIFFSADLYACATCGCSLSPEGALGYGTDSGWALSLDDSFINQNQLRSASSPVSQTRAQSVSDQEVENQTVNRYLTFGISYSPNADWNVKLALPYIDRSHTTYGTDAVLPLTPDQLSSATAAGLGDIKLIASYQGLLPTKNFGIQAGLKLPSGNYGGFDASNPTGTIGQGSTGRNPVGFGANGNAGSTYLDTSLNVGNGSTDFILGAYYYQPVSQDFDAFVNGSFEFSVKQQLDQTGADFRPGNQANLSFGVRYEANPMIVPQLQINLIDKKADSGALADTNDTAGTAVYLSPGVTMNVMRNAQIYGFLQIPVYSNLSGYQLFPRYTVSAGLNYHF